MRFNWDEIRDLESRKLVTVRPHPTADLAIVNYTDHAQHGWLWDAHPLLLECRGLILDPAGTVVAKGFKKFFGTSQHPSVSLDRLATLGEPEITEKLDGSLAILYPYQGLFGIATRGSFVSEQAIAGTALWVRRYARIEPDLGPYTYLFEFVGPTNRIVVRYPREELVLIGLVEPGTGLELPWARVRAEAERLGFPLARTYEEPWQGLAGRPVPNFEGYVLHWPDHGVRAKIKLEDYLRLHRIVSSLSEKSVWEALKDGTAGSLRDQLPEEHHAWFDGVAGSLARVHEDHARYVRETLARVAHLDPRVREERARIARAFAQEPAATRPALFRALEHDDWERELWKVLEP
jgi:RNA ligase